MRVLSGAEGGGCMELYAFFCLIEELGLDIKNLGITDYLLQLVTN